MRSAIVLRALFSSSLPARTFFPKWKNNREGCHSSSYPTSLCSTAVHSNTIRLPRRVTDPVKVTLIRGQLKEYLQENLGQQAHAFNLCWVTVLRCSGFG